MVQDLIVYSLIAAALGNMVYHGIKLLTRKNKTECTGCPSCGVKNELSAKKLSIKHLN